MILTSLFQIVAIQVGSLALQQLISIALQELTQQSYLVTKFCKLHLDLKGSIINCILLVQLPSLLKTLNSLISIPLDFTDQFFRMFKLMLDEILVCDEECYLTLQISPILLVLHLLRSNFLGQDGGPRFTFLRQFPVPKLCCSSLQSLLPFNSFRLSHAKQELLGVDCKWQDVQRVVMGCSVTELPRNSYESLVLILNEESLRHIANEVSYQIDFKVFDTRKPKIFREGRLQYRKIWFLYFYIQYERDNCL